MSGRVTLVERSKVLCFLVAEVESVEHGEPGEPGKLTSSCAACSGIWPFSCERFNVKSRVLTAFGLFPDSRSILILESWPMPNHLRSLPLDVILFARRGETH